MNRVPLRRPVTSLPSKLRRRVERLTNARTAQAPDAGQSPPTPVPPLQKHWPWGITLVVTLALNYVLISTFFPGQPQRVEVSYTFFKQQVGTDNVAEISSRADTIQGTFRQGAAYPPDAGTAAKTVQDF